FAPDGKTAASGDIKGTAKLWEMPGGKERSTIKTGHQRITRLAFSPNGRLLAVGGTFGDLKLWDTSTGKDVAHLEDKGAYDIMGLSFSPDGRLLLAGCQGEKASDRAGRLTFWDVKARRIRATIPGTTHEGAAALSPDGKLLAASDFDHSIKVWEVAGFLA